MLSTTILPEESPRELVIATKNKGKVREFAALLAGLGFVLRGLDEFAETPDVPETGGTFAENARLKAVGYAAATKRLTLADDSGLEIDALNKAPGVYSARYGGEKATDADRIKLLLRELSAFTLPAERRARFVCVIALHDPYVAQTYFFDGVCEGAIAHAARGTRGFGYDPVFIPDGFRETFGELPDEVKSRISHRARAVARVRGFLVQSFPA